MEQLTLDKLEDNLTEWVEFDGTNLPSEANDYLVTVKGKKLNHEIYVVYYSPLQTDYKGEPIKMVSGNKSKDEFLAVGWSEVWDITEEVIAWRELPKPYERKENNNE